jgi:hypothetical protein
LIEQLHKAERRAAQSALRVLRQRELIIQLEHDGADTREAQKLLEILQQIETSHLADRDRLRELVEAN